jgi:thiosulfate reductase cytochrome b subunit
MMEAMWIKQRHSLALRVCHWINVPVILLLIWSGVLIYWAYPAYGAIPQWASQNFNLHHRLAEGMGWHFSLMWIFILNGLVYLLHTLGSGHWRELLPGKSDFKNLAPFVLSDLHITRKKFPKTEGYNPAQKFAYSGVIFLALGTILTGFAILKPVQLSWLVNIFGGYQTARFLHFLTMLGLVFFILVHLMQVIRGGWNAFQAMISGYQDEN